jgi:hypothetical protein
LHNTKTTFQKLLIHQNEEGIMQQNLFDALIRNRVNLAENFDALPRFVNLFIVKIHCILIQGVLVIVFNPTFNNISDISWQVEETGVPRENHRPAVSYVYIKS